MSDHGAKRGLPDPHTGGPSRFPLITADEARVALAAFGPIGTEEVAVADAAGRVLHRDVRARTDVPHFARSYMDGYAVRAADTTGASTARPAILRVTGGVEMGRAAGRALRPREARRIPTGGMLPRGADAVVMVEHTHERPDGTVAVAHAVHADEHVMHRGDDVRRGALVFAAGRRLRPQDVGALSGIGVSRVRVHRRPVVAILATGDEIVPPEVTPGPGQVRNVNQYALRALVVANGGRVLDTRVLPDRAAVIERALRRALRTADLVLMSGGSSVGMKDLTPDVVRAVGGRLLFHGIRIKPGKPTLLARAGRTPILGLPGNPTSAMVIFHLFGLPLLRRLGGEPIAEAFAPRAPVVARLVEPVPSAVGREDWIRVRVDVDAEGEPTCQPLRGGSGEIIHFAQADGLVRVPADDEALSAGTRVAVRPLG